MTSEGMKIMFCHIGWMEKYDGQYQIEGGGEFVRDNGFGLEMYNFAPSDGGKIYGYAKNTKEKLKIERLGALRNAKKIDEVTVVWTAKKPKPENGIYIIGWYVKAAVFRDLQDTPQSLNRKDPHGNLWRYNMLVSDADAVLLPVAERTQKVPDKGKNGPGRANVWYADNRQDFVDEIMRYIEARYRPEA